MLWAMAAGRRAAYSRTDTGVRWLDAHDGTAYGVTSSDTWATTPDGFTVTDTTIPALYGGQPVIDLRADGAGFVLHTAATIDEAGIPGGSGAIWIGPTLDAMTARTPPTFSVAVCGRTSVVDRNAAGVILVGEYSYTTGTGKIHRTVDGGATWTTATISGIRHIHGVHFDPNDPDIAWATTGDGAIAPRGLYRSEDSGASWALVAHGQYPIDFGFLDDGTFVGEGDGVGSPHIVTWIPAYGTSFFPAITPAMAEAATGQTDWRGTTRALGILGPDRIFYTTTAEEGATGTRWGIWEARRSEGAWTPILLEELDDRWMIMARTLQMSGRVLLSHTYRFTLPS